MISAVQHYLRETVKLFPSKIAVKYHSDEVNESITYSELDRFSDEFGYYLQEMDVQKEEMVAFFMPKSVSAIKTIISIVKSAGAYVPLDINTPEERLASIIKESKVRLVIVNSVSVERAEKIFESIDKKVKIINVDDFTFDITKFSYPVQNTISVDLAYVLFTSGSTGTPKGVMIQHDAIIDYIDWCVETYGLTSNDHIANHAPLHFDNSTFDIYTALKAGATLHLVPDSVNIRTPKLVDWLQCEGITVFFCVPSILSLLLQTKALHQAELSQLKQILCAGEVLPIRVLRKWMLLFPHIRFTNMYGPTEITVDCSYHIINSVPSFDEKYVPIGLPRSNMEMYIMTDEGKVTRDVGSCGELLVRGRSVSRGYLGNKEKTDECFIQNPMNDKYTDVFYKTGDLVFTDNNGVFYYSGRVDDQIKHFGYRIELGEIEVGSLRLNFVDEAVAIYNKSSTELDSFIGLAVKTSCSIEPNELRASLAKTLPHYMIPTKIIFINKQFPRLANGKYDRKAISKLFS